MLALVVLVASAVYTGDMGSHSGLHCQAVDSAVSGPR